jgi:hypothetical protein
MPGVKTQRSPLRRLHVSSAPGCVYRRSTRRLIPRLVRRYRLGVGRLVRAAASTDANPINDDRAWRGQYREILAGIVLIGDQRRRLTGLVEGLAEETVPGGGRGLERGGRFKSVFRQQRDLTGNGPSGVCPSQDGHAEAMRERQQFGKPLPVLGNPPPGSLRGGIGKTEHRAQGRRPGGPGPGHQPQRRFIDCRAMLDRVHVCGGAANELELADRFTHVFLLEIDEPTMLARVDARPDNDWGRIGDTREYLRRKLPELQARLRASGAIPIDATQPLDQVVDGIARFRRRGWCHRSCGKSAGMALDCRCRV